MQIPFGYTEINDYNFNTFGIYHRLMFEVIEPDYEVLVLPYEYSNIDIIKRIQEISQKKYNQSIDSFYLSNCNFDLANEVIMDSSEHCLFINQQKVIDNYSILNKHVQGNNIVIDVDSLFNLILKKLEE